MNNSLYTQGDGGWGMGAGHVGGKGCPFIEYKGGETGPTFIVVVPSNEPVSSRWELITFSLLGSRRAYAHISTL